ncbi:SWI/SNF complex subunit SWI3D [Bienertia sinuspersici]
MEVDRNKEPKSTETTPGYPKSKETTPGSPKSKETTQTKDDDNVAKLKRAALATLSAAAVKSKLLANQEEDEIRQLATILIEKQMRKLEVKLSYFTEMENAIMRVRDQLERSRQKLYNERAQIIASRLGMPPSSRMLPSSYPLNRMPPGLLNSMLRPPTSSGAQRPPMSRPVVTSAPPTTGTSASAPPEVAGGSPKQPSAMDQPSSVGTK